MGGVGLVWEEVNKGYVFRVLINHNKELGLYLSCAGRTTEGF